MNEHTNRCSHIRWNERILFFIIPYDCRLTGKLLTTAAIGFQRHNSSNRQQMITSTPSLHLDPDCFCLGGNKAGLQGVRVPPTKRTHTLGQRVQGLRLWSEFQRAWPEQIWGFRNSHPATPLSRSLPGLVGISKHETGMTGTSTVWPLFHLWNAPPTPQTASCL